MPVPCRICPCRHHKNGWIITDKNWDPKTLIWVIQGYYPNRTPKATYAAMISYLDEQVGEIVAKLKEIGEYENTFIVFSSDNGPTHKDKQADIHFFNSTGIFVNSKTTVKGNVNEGGIRVPTIATWPK